MTDIVPPERLKGAELVVFIIFTCDKVVWVWEISDRLWEIMGNYHKFNQAIAPITNTLV